MPDPGYGDCRRQPGYGHAEVPCAFGGLDAVTHAMEAYVSVLHLSSLMVRLCRH